MTNFRTAFAAAALVAGLSAPAFAAVDTSDPQRFVQTLTADGLGAVRSGSLAAAKTQLRGLLINHVAVDAMGDRLIRRWLPTITPAQRAAYKAALPNYIVGTYADNLLNYRDATVKVVRVVPNAAGADVMTQVLKPGRQPLAAVWSVVKEGGAWKVSNLRVAGINVAMAQAADFDSVVQRQGFDALVAMMKSRR
jgi:phospholipid transport system substrate-binding protein